jgi:ATP-dependent helicase/nuclease subunit A
MTDLATPAATPAERASRRQRQASDPWTSAWVTANAGTGKTKVLTDRVLRLLLAGTLPNRILCITFTRAAAAEMRKRVAGDLSDWATLDDAALAAEIHALTDEAPDTETLDGARRLFATVLDDSIGLRIDTIHAFCQEVLKRFPLEAGVAPHFEVLTERDATDLLDEARRQVLSSAQADGPASNPGMAAAVDALSIEIDDRAFDEVMAALTAARHRLAGSLGATQSWAGALRDVLALTTDQTAAGLTAAFVAADTGRDQALAQAATALQGDTDAERKRGVALHRWLDAEPDRRTALLPAYELVFLTTGGERRKKLANKAPREAMPDIEDILGAEADRLMDYKARLQPVRLFELNQAVLRLAEAVINRFEQLKAGRAALDYADLIERVRRLLQSGQAAWVQFKLDEGIEHVLVDEAQDTSADQWQLVQSITDEFYTGMDQHEDKGLDRSVFVVGDPKQSIFSFQGADAAVFSAAHETYRRRVTDAGRRWEDVPLMESFRSTQAVLDIVDQTFADDETSAGVRAAGDLLQHTAVREDQYGRVELWPLAPAIAAEDEEPWDLPTVREGPLAPNLALARQIANTIKGWWESREPMVWVRPQNDPPFLRPLRPSDVMILVRRRNELVDMIVRELKAADVPVAGVDRMHLGEQISVMDLMVLGDFLLLPSDNLALATVLKSPLIGLSEDQLFALAHGRERTLWQQLGLSDDPDSVQARKRLGDWLDQVDYLSPFDFFSRVLDSATGDPRQSGRRDIRARLGSEADDPIDEFLTLAATYEATRTPSMQDFLHWVRRGETVIKRDLDQADRDEVRVMTVHGAKGLQAPIVFMPDTVSIPRDSDRILWGGEDDVPLWAPLRRYETETMKDRRAESETRRLEEYRRLLYVALTRAEDRLIVCGASPKTKIQEGCWYEAVKGGIARLGEPAEMTFANWTGEGWVYDRGKQATGDVREDETAATPRQEWLYAPAPPEDTPPRPLTPSRAVEEEPPVFPPLAEDGGSRFRRGLVIHRLLQSLPDLPPDDRENAINRYLSRPAVSLGDEENAQIAAEVLALLSDPALASLFGPGSRAEVPLTGLVDGHVVSGQIDRLVVDNHSVSIVDYKPNRPPPLEEAGVAPLYAAQMALYRALLHKIYPGREVNCSLLWTSEARIMQLSGAFLDVNLPTAGVVDPGDAAT